MVQITEDYLAQISGVRLNDNLRSVFHGLRAGGAAAGLLAPHRLVHYLSQLAHESMDYRYDREVWDGRGAQARYDVRTDLGNTPERDGDGYKYRGRTATQITGKANTREFRDWVRGFIPNAPDFVEDPDLMNTDPYEGLGPIWYWQTRNLNRYADAGDPEMITKIINGGYNGLGDRLANFAEIGLRVLGYDAGAVRQFQADAGLVADGIAGRKTRAAIQLRLEVLPVLTFDDPPRSDDPMPDGPPHSAVLLIAQIRRLIAEYDA